METTVWNYLRTVMPFTPYPYTGDHTTCPNCQGEGQTIAKRDRYWKFLSTDVCKNCGLFFTNPMPRDDELDAYYKSLYRSTYGGLFKSVPKDYVERRRKEAARRAGIVVDLFPDPKGLRSLDLGSGLGALVEALEARGFDAYGFEPGNILSQHLKNERIKHGTWRDVEFEKGTFDFVSIIHVLEHLRTPLDCLRMVHGLLKDDGLFWIEVPDMQAYGTKSAKRFHFAHVLGFSKENLIDAAFRCGFVPVKEISKEQIGKRRSQVSIVFRKARPGDTVDVDLSSTAQKNLKDYGSFSHVGHAFDTLRGQLGKAQGNAVTDRGS